MYLQEPHGVALGEKQYPFFSYEHNEAQGGQGNCSVPSSLPSLPIVIERTLSLSHLIKRKNKLPRPLWPLGPLPGVMLVPFLVLLMDSRHSRMGCLPLALFPALPRSCTRRSVAHSPYTHRKYQAAWTFSNCEAKGHSSICKHTLPLKILPSACGTSPPFYFII